MRIVSDIIRQGRNLRFSAGIGPQFKILNFRIGDNRRRRALSGVAADRQARAIDQWAIVLDEAFERFPTQVQTVERGVPALEIGHDAQGLRVVIKAAKPGETFI